MRPRALVLAAGNGRRAGGPKAWALDQGTTLLERQSEFLLKRFEAERIHISIQEGWRERCRAIDARIRWTAVDPEAQALASLQALIGASAHDDWAFMHHVDMPVWEEEVFEALAAAAHDGPEAVVAAHQGRRGHPILLSPGAQGRILSLDPKTDRLDVWLRARNVCAVELPFPCVLENWNTPAHV